MAPGELPQPGDQAAGRLVATHGASRAVAEGPGGELALERLGGIQQPVAAGIDGELLEMELEAQGHDFTLVTRPAILCREGRCMSALRAVIRATGRAVRPGAFRRAAYSPGLMPARSR